MDIIDQVMKEAGIVKSANLILEFRNNIQVQRFLEKVEKLKKKIEDVRINNKRVTLKGDEDEIGDIAFSMGGRFANKK